MTVSPAQHSAASPDWGTPMLLRRLAQRVLRHAAVSGMSSIDLDYASSTYWQRWWPDQDAPAAFLDGSVPDQDVRFEAARRRYLPWGGTGFCNAPGLEAGDMVKQCWQIFEADHRAGCLKSGVWIGFSVEQFASLQGGAPRNPLSGDLVVTLVPSRRARYVLHPEAAIAVSERKMAGWPEGSSKWKAELRKVEKLRARTDDAPVPGNAPSHASYVTVLLSGNHEVQRDQRAALNAFLAEQKQQPKSLLYRCEVVGSLG